jgi:hypothetical protein
MQHAHRLDQVEAVTGDFHFQQVGLRIFDIGRAHFCRLARGMTEAGATDIHRQHTRIGKARAVSIALRPVPHPAINMSAGAMSCTRQASPATTQRG